MGIFGGSIKNSKTLGVERRLMDMNWSIRQAQGGFSSERYDTTKIGAMQAADRAAFG
jgi:hypothetical protein